MRKWEIVLNNVLDDIQSERLAPGERFYTLNELSEKYSVSSTTAQRVFQELGMRRVIITNRRAGSVVTGAEHVKTAYLCLRDDHFSNSGRLDRFRAIDAFLEGFRSRLNGMFVKVEPVGLEFLRTHIGEFAGQPILVSANAFLDVTEAGALLNQNLLDQFRARLNPIVFHGFCPLPGLNQVGTDLYGGMRRIVDLLAQRHTGFGCLMGNPRNPWFRPRLRGYMDALLDHDLVFDPERLKITEGEDPEEDFRAMDAILKGPERPTALVCASDLRALHALEYCQRHGIAVPDELAITGFDNLPESAMSYPPLTTLDGQDAESGRRAADLILKRALGSSREPTCQMLDRELIIREST